MNIVVCDIGQLVVVNVAHRRNVDAACGDVCGDENFNLAFFEGFDCAFALALAFVAVNAVCCKACGFELFLQLLGAVLCASEDKRSFVGVLAEVLDEQGRLGGLGHEVHRLVNTLDGLAGRGSLNADRVV